MIIVVDTNILYSSITNPNGKIADIFFLKKQKFFFYSSKQLFVEIKKHKSKLLAYTHLNSNEFRILFSSFTKKIEFLDIDFISKNNWEKAEKLLIDIDIEDVYFIALTLELKAWLWTGDKKLYNGLKKKNFKKVVSTTELLKYSYKKK